MNIGIVTTWFERGGAYVSQQYLKVLQEKFNVFIYARAGEEYGIGNPKWDKDYVTWGKRSGLPPISTGIDLKDFKNWIEEKNLELVFFNEQKHWEPVILCEKMGVKTGAYIDYYTEETLPLFGSYDFLICNTKRHYEAFKWHSQVFYIPWGTDIGSFVPKTLKNNKENEVVFFHSCGYNPKRKGTDLLIKAFAKLQGKGRLIIHSQVNIKDFFPDLEEMITLLKRQGRILIIKKTISSPGIYHFGDVYVYPTRSEGIGLTIMEALSCGLPVITSDYPPMNEFVNDQNGKLTEVEKIYSRKDGFYWPQCEVKIEKLRENMEWFIENPQKIAKEKIIARSYAEDCLNWFQNAKNLPTIFSEIEKVEKKYPIKQAKKYEENSPNVFFRLYKKSPVLFKLFRKIWNFMGN